MLYSTSQLRDLSFVFSRSEAIRWFKGDFSTLNNKLERHNMLVRYENKSYSEMLIETYKLMANHYQNEYFLKNEFLNKWLINELGKSESILFSEFRIGNAIADLAMFNGRSKAFEIKTLLDNNSRLTRQLAEYKKIFNEVYLIVPEECLEKYINYDREIGVISYNAQKRVFKLQVMAKENISIDIDVLMQVLRTKEYLWIVNQYCKDVPLMNAFNQFEISKNIISAIPRKELNSLFLEVMKKREINSYFVKNKYKFLNQLSLSLNLKKVDIDVMIRHLKTQTL